MMHASFKIIERLVLKKMILKFSVIHGHGGHFGNVTETMFTKFIFPLQNKALPKILI